MQAVIHVVVMLDIVAPRVQVSIFSYGRTLSGGPLEGGGSKNKNRAGETERKKFVHQKSFEKKYSCRDFSIGKIIS
jgi:hypothetical protein